MPKEKLTVGVTGGRSYRDYFTVQKALAKVSARFDITVVHGDCPTGADAWARQWCEMTGTPERRYPADWETKGQAAGFLRNEQMAKEAGIQLLLAFPGGPGTNDMVQRCHRYGIPLKLIPERVSDDRSQALEVAAAQAAA
jgi:hypothetical protein